MYKLAKKRFECVYTLWESSANGRTMVATAFQLFRFSPFAEADAFKDRILNQEDVPKVVCEILGVQTKSKTFGRVLRLPKVTVNSIHLHQSDPQECLFDVLDEFVKQVEPPPTWRVILEALRHPLIGQHHLAQEIESKYCPRPPTDYGSYTYCVSQSMHELFVTSLAEPRPVQKSGHTVAITTPVSMESSNTIQPGIACNEGQKVGICLKRLRSRVMPRNMSEKANMLIIQTYPSLAEPHPRARSARVWRQALLRFVPCCRNLAVQSDCRTALLRHVTRSAY